MRTGKPWTRAEEEKLLKEYKEKGAIKLAKELGRTAAAVRRKYFGVQGAQSDKRKPKISQCPGCGSNRINKVITWQGKTRHAYYCLECLHEFTERGEIIPPLYAE